MRDFQDVEPTNSADPANWMQQLSLNANNGQIKPTIDNVRIILENDPLLKDRFAFNTFAGMGEVLGILPWSNSADRRLWSDTDSNGLYWYIEKYYGSPLTGTANPASTPCSSTTSARRMMRQDMSAL